MDLKKRTDLRIKLFVPVFIIIWGLILGLIYWQTNRVRKVREEMAIDQLSVISSLIVGLYETEDTVNVARVADLANLFYEPSTNYDPISVWIVNPKDGSVLHRYGTSVRETFKIPNNKYGIITVPESMLDDTFTTDTRFVYTSSLIPDRMLKVYVMLPYTKRMTQVINSRTTYVFVVFIIVGILLSIVSYIAIYYFGKNIKMLKDFVYKASDDPNLSVEDLNFPHSELGDISRKIIEIYNQRTHEIKRREREHQVALNAVQEKDRIKRELTANINHELKTPVGVIQGYIDTIIDSPDMDAETRNKFMLKTQESVHRLSQLIADITSITKLESGGKLVNVSELDFHDLVFSFANFIEEGNVLQDKMTFTFDLPLNCMVLGNDSLLTTVLTNFVKNSVAYSEGTICRLVCTREDDDFYYFTYYDNGIGVSPEHLPHMFERFYRVNAGRSRNVGGTGLGLSIVEVTITSLGGTIEVSNHFPTGLEFNFSLPKFKKKEITPAE